MRKLALFLFIAVVAGCRDKSENVGPNRADHFVGTYYATQSATDKSSFYVWVVTRKANNKLNIGYYIEDSYPTGNNTSRKREVYFLEDVTISNDSTFAVNETDSDAAVPTRIEGTGSLKRFEDGSEKILINLSFTGTNNQSVRNAEYVELLKVPNLIDDDPTVNDFDYIGTYQTELPEASKTATHKWVVNFKNSSTFSVDYSINDRFNQGSIVELLNSYTIQEVKKLNNNSLAIDLTVEETNSKDKIRIKALGTKLVRGVSEPPRIATIVKIVNETQNITRMEYLELRKQQ